MMDYSHNLQMDLWNKTNYGAQMKHLKAAGLNPGLLYGMGGSGGQSTAAPTGSVNGANAPSGGGEILNSIGMGLQMGLQKAQIEVLESQARKNQVEADKAAGVDTENVKADTANKVLAQVITHYTGQELKDYYERVASPGRSIQAKTYTDELEARQGIANNIYELWRDGKLKEKSVGEIESILLGNAKTRAEKAEIYKKMELLDENIKGAKLDNIINEIETKLQQQTGIDRSAPSWLKIIGRLFGDLMPTH